MTIEDTESILGVAQSVLALTQQLLDAQSQTPEALTDIGQLVFQRGKQLEALEKAPLETLSAENRQHLAQIIQQLQALDPQVLAVLEQFQQNLDRQIQSLQASSQMLGHYRSGDAQQPTSHYDTLG